MCTQYTVILSYYVNEIDKKGCFVVKRHAVGEAKTWRYAVHKAEVGRHAVRTGVSPSWKWIVVHVLSLSGLRFQIKYIENTRLVLNIAQVYPARLRKSKITRLAE